MPVFQNSKLAQLHDYWHAKRRDQGLPARADLSPFEMRFIIGNVCLVDVIAGDPPGFRMRLLGTNIVLALGGGESQKIVDWTGKTFDDMPVTEFRTQVRQSFETATKSRDIVVAYRDGTLDGRRYNYEAVVLPLASDGTTVDMLLVGLIYGGRERAAQ
jgi:hypothetical protein